MYHMSNLTRSLFYFFVSLVDVVFPLTYTLLSALVLFVVCVCVCAYGRGLQPVESLPRDDPMSTTPLTKPELQYALQSPTSSQPKTVPAVSTPKASTPTHSEKSLPSPSHPAATSVTPQDMVNSSTLSDDPAVLLADLDLPDLPSVPSFDDSRGMLSHFLSFPFLSFSLSIHFSICLYRFK